MLNQKVFKQKSFVRKIKSNQNYSVTFRGNRCKMTSYKKYMTHPQNTMSGRCGGCDGRTNLLCDICNRPQCGECSRGTLGKNRFALLCDRCCGIGCTQCLKACGTCGLAFCRSCFSPSHLTVVCKAHDRLACQQHHEDACLLCIQSKGSETLPAQTFSSNHA